MHTEIYTYFTIPDGRTKLLYSAENWVRIELQLETAGPVAVSTRQDVSPVLSGKGILLPPTLDLSIDFVLPKGDRVFIVAEAVNRVKFIVEPIAWQEQILRGVGQIVDAIKGIRIPVAGRHSAPPESPSRQAPPCPPPFKPPYIP